MEVLQFVALKPPGERPAVGVIFGDKDEKPCLVLICFSRSQIKYNVRKNGGGDGLARLDQSSDAEQDVPEDGVDEPAIAIEGQAALYFHAATITK